MTFETNFTITADINTLAGNTTNQGWSAADHQLKLIKSEFEELTKGIAERDLHELRDGIVDVLFTVYGLAHRCGIDADKDFKEMLISQLTKFDDALSNDATKSLLMFEDKGVDIVTRQGYLGDKPERQMSYIAATDQVDDKGREIPKGKWLKGHRFQEPVFSPLPEQEGFHQLLLEDTTMPEPKHDTLYLYLATCSLEDQPELRVAKALGFNLSRPGQPSLESMGEPEVRQILEDYHSGQNADFTIQLVKDTTGDSVKDLVKKYQGQGYHVHQISIV